MLLFSSAVAYYVGFICSERGRRFLLAEFIIGDLFGDGDYSYTRESPVAISPNLDRQWLSTVWIALRLAKFFLPSRGETFFFTALYRGAVTRDG